LEINKAIRLTDESAVFGDDTVPKGQIYYVSNTSGLDVLKEYVGCRAVDWVSGISALMTKSVENPDSTLLLLRSKLA
jgi:hypothetical protein